jgi:acetyl-CoA carboxylase biotin carboxyl carrier protein
VAREIVAEMVANIQKFVVSAGDEVAEGRHHLHPRVDEDGDPRAHRDGGKVAELRVSEGDVVQEGDILAVLA